MDENNQYGFAMTKPMPTGCIKENSSPSWIAFNLLLETVSLDDEIGLKLKIRKFQLFFQFFKNLTIKKFLEMVQ